MKKISFWKLFTNLDLIRYQLAIVEDTWPSFKQEFMKAIGSNAAGMKIYNAIDAIWCAIKK